MSSSPRLLDKYIKAYSDLSVACLRADDAACGHYRISYPAEFLARSGARVQIFNGFRTHDLLPFDIILAQRQYHDGVFDMLMELQYAGKTIIYEIDDNVHQVLPTSVAYSTYKPGSQTCHGVLKFLKSCDGLFCTGPELASYYGQYSDRTWVLPNQIDFGVRDWTSPVERDPRLQGKLVLGWAGSITHEKDAEALKGCLSVILEKYPQTIFAMASAHLVLEQFRRELKLPEDRVVALDPVDFELYPALPAQFDIGLIPVIPTQFNSSKSDLKILEFGARGVPYVASRLAPYVRFHQETEGQGGYLASTKEEWVAALSTLIENEEERRTKSEWIRNHIRTERSYDNNIWRWAQALREARDLRHSQPEAIRKYEVPSKVGRNDKCPCGSGKKAKRCCSIALV